MGSCALSSCVCQPLERSRWAGKWRKRNVLLNLRWLKKIASSRSCRLWCLFTNDWWRAISIYLLVLLLLWHYPRTWFKVLNLGSNCDEKLHAQLLCLLSIISLWFAVLYCFCQGQYLPSNNWLNGWWVNRRLISDLTEISRNWWELVKRKVERDWWLIVIDCSAPYAMMARWPCLHNTQSTLQTSESENTTRNGLI